MQFNQILKNSPAGARFKNRVISYTNTMITLVSFVLAG